MRTFTYYNNLKLLTMPVIWSLILLFAYLVKDASWGRSGHPSNALILYIYTSLGSPLFGLAGLIHVKLKGENNKLKIFAILLNICIILYGIGIWFWWKIM